MATATFRLRNPNTDKATIYVYLSVERKKQFLATTKIKINPKDWNFEPLLDENGKISIDENGNEERKKSLVGYPKNSTNPIIKNIVSKLKKLDTFLTDEVNQANIDGTPINSVWVKEQINNCFNRVTPEDEQKEIEQKEQNKLTVQIQSFIDNADIYKHSSGKLGLSNGRVKNLKAFKNRMLEFEQYTNKTIYLKNINKKFELGLDSWLKKVKKYSVNTSGTVVKNLKVICSYSKENELEVHPYYQFIKVYKQDKKDKIIQTLSFDELETIENWQTANERLNNVKKWLLIGCNIGQRVEDLINITLKNFVTINDIKYIELNQEKTEKDVLIPINEQCQRVLNTGIPYKISQQKLNDYIKEVCKLAEIDEVIEGDLFDKETKRKVRGFYPKYKLITSHSFRRSYATNYYIDVPTPVIMEVTGHSKESTFLEYINKPVDKTRNANLMLELMELAESKRASKKETPVIEMKSINK